MQVAVALVAYHDSAGKDEEIFPWEQDREASVGEYSMSKNVGFNVLKAASGHSVGAERYLVRGK